MFWWNILYLNAGWIHPFHENVRSEYFSLHHMSIGWQSGEGAHLWCTGINNRWGVQENTFLSKTHQKLSFYQKYIKKLSFYLKYIKSSKSIINRCQDLLGITKGGSGLLKAIEGLCAMMAPSEWGSGYEPLLRMGVGMGGRMGGWVDMNLFWGCYSSGISGGLHPLMILSAPLHPSLIDFRTKYFKSGQKVHSQWMDGGSAWNGWWL